MRIGVPTEIKPAKRRVALTSSGALEIVHEVVARDVAVAVAA